MTSNLNRRLQEHADQDVKSTRYRTPFILIYYESYLAFEDAKVREKKIKQFKNAYTELKKRINNSLLYEFSN